MHNPNEWKAGPDGSVVAGGETVCRDAKPGDRALILRAPQMHEFLYDLSRGENPFAEHAGRLISLADGHESTTLLPFPDSFDVETEDDEDAVRA